MKTLITVVAAAILFMSCATHNGAVQLKQTDSYVVRVDSIYRFGTDRHTYFVYLAEKKTSLNQQYMIEIDESQLKYYPVGSWKQLHPPR